MKNKYFSFEQRVDINSGHNNTESDIQKSHYY